MIKSHGAWQELTRIVDDFSVHIRITFNNGLITNWSGWLSFPENSYAEISGHGPFRINDVRAIEINPIEIKKIGRLIPEKRIDHSGEIISELNLAGINCAKTDDNFIIIIID